MVNAAGHAPHWRRCLGGAAQSSPENPLWVDVELLLRRKDHGSSWLLRWDNERAPADIRHTGIRATFGLSPDLMSSRHIIKLGTNSAFVANCGFTCRQPSAQKCIQTGSACHVMEFMRILLVQAQGCQSVFIMTECRSDSMLGSKLSVRKMPVPE